MFAAFITGAKPFDLAVALESWAATHPDHLVPDIDAAVDVLLELRG